MTRQAPLLLALLLALPAGAQAPSSLAPRVRFETSAGDFVIELDAVRSPLTAENFLLSFSLPNFYFHATTAYDIIRQCGVEVGKRDFMGSPPA